MGIRTYFYYGKQLRFLKKMIKKCRPYMKNGTYMLFPSMRALACTEGDSVEKAKKYFIHHTKKKTNKAVSFVNKHSLFKIKKGNGQYEAIYVANNLDKNREIKLFSFRQNKILTVCVSPEDNEQQLAEYSLLHHAYGMPAVSASTLFPNSHEISMISVTARPNEIVALNAVATANEKFNPDNSILAKVATDDLLSYSYEDSEMNGLLEKLKSKINIQALPKEFPTILQHGDLSQDNLMYGTADGSEGFFWIDWEHKHERIFFYDLFFYMLNSAFCSDVFEPLNAYMQGECDELLEKHFAHFGLSYDSERKKDYFLLFAIIFCKERLCPFHRVGALAQYVDFLSELHF